jgi:toxin FitB
MVTLVDTNVLSELVRPVCAPSVAAWFGSRPAHTLFVSAITQAEMSLGARLMPAGKRRDALQAAIRGIFEQDFAGRILPFDSAAALAYVEIVAARRSAGRPISQFDAQIAAIARVHRFEVATRNTADFQGCGSRLVDPWTD